MESNLSRTFSDLKSEVGYFLGYGKSPTGTELTDTEEIVHAGYRQFLYPPVLPGHRAAHEWGFLTDRDVLITAASKERYDLPDVFGGVDGNFTYLNPQSGNISIQVVSDNQIRGVKQNNSTVTGRPKLAAIRAKSFAGVDGQRFEVVFWPTPDGAYELQYGYILLPRKLTTEAPYPLGGMQHGETILESCLAVAELRRDDERGIHWQAFLSQLATSVSVDSRGTHAEYLGYNGDNSDGGPNGRGGRGYWNDRTATVTYGSVQY